MNIADLPYYKIFTKEERIAANASQGYRCNICGMITVYSDIMNLEDHPQILDILSIVCPDCRTRHRQSFEEKREKHFGKNNESTN